MCRLQPLDKDTDWTDEVKVKNSEIITELFDFEIAQFVDKELFGIPCDKLLGDRVPNPDKLSAGQTSSVCKL